MQSTIKKSNTKTKKEKLPDETEKARNEKLQTSSYSTPRNYLQKNSAADIYGQNKKDNIHSLKAPKKPINTINKTSYVSPMKGLLNSSPSSTSYSSITTSSRDKIPTKVNTKEIKHTSKKVKDFNVTVNSSTPVVKRRLNSDKGYSFLREDSRATGVGSPVLKKRFNIDKENSFVKEGVKKVQDTLKASSSKVDSQNVTSKVANARQRTKTRTLLEDEVKILTSDAMDNNKEMFNLTKKLSAAPKAYFIDFEDDKQTCAEQPLPRPKTPSDGEISYEDDFESYESDFDSYHSSPSEQNENDDKMKEDCDDGDDDIDEVNAETEAKEIKDEERMLDSGSFELRDQRSATKTKSPLDLIIETAEGGEDKRSSLTDEGFQEMSSSSGVSSIKMINADVLDRPNFIDFKISQKNKRKKKMNERLRQRAKDLLSIITLHEISYSLFEMKPISYDLFMATFGKSNNNQIAVQTFDDSITEEIQTDEIECENKWTQHPVKFSKNDICISNEHNDRKSIKNIDNYMMKFAFLTKDIVNVKINNAYNVNENYKTDPLRIYFEQKNGAGPSEMLPYEIYKSKLKNNDFNSLRLNKFLKKNERRMCNVLNRNNGDSELSKLKISKYAFSKGYILISAKNSTDEKLLFLNNTKICQVFISETKNNFILTVHDTLKTAVKKCIICLWDTSVARRKPTKILIAVDNVAVGRFRGAMDGFFVAALEDGSIHLWDLSDGTSWRPDIANDEKQEELVEINEKELTPFERDREWIKSNSHVGLEDSIIQCSLQPCAFTNSAYNISSGDAMTSIVGLEFIGNQIINQETQRIVGQVAALQIIGVLTVWSIIQEKSKTVPPDIGKAFWAKMKLERKQIINLIDYIDVAISESQNKLDFNLNTAKRRLANRKQVKKDFRAKSAVEVDRPTSASNFKQKKVLPVQKDVGRNWEIGMVCYDLKVALCGNNDTYLIAKNCGEVLSCKKNLGAIRVTRYSVANDVSSVTCLELSPHKLPYYLAATDSGTISVCSLHENRVLLTLDCRNIPVEEKCLSDDKGRYVTTVSNRSSLVNETRMDFRRINSISWSRVNPCCIFATVDGSILSWDLAHSDIFAKCASKDAAATCIAGDNILALLTPDGDVHVHKLTNDNKNKEYLMLFEKYITLL